MKKIIVKSKSGFTLLEVVLAVVILVVASTMIMKGFVAVMIMGRNSRNYTKSGEQNYRRAMNETIIRHATAPVQYDNVVVPLTGGVQSTLTAAFESGHTPSNVTANQMNLTVDLSMYTNTEVNVTDSSDNAYVIGGDTIDASTVADNRYAFFYDYGDYIGATNYAATHDGNHNLHWGYTTITVAQYNSLTNYHKRNCVALTFDEDDNPTSYRFYGFYCFNSNHVHDDAGNMVPDSCRTFPVTPVGA